jgi:hypothetical protein
LDGSEVDFQPSAALVPGTYRFELELSLVGDLLGKTDPLGVRVSGTFSLASDERIRKFEVHGVSTGPTLEVTGSWLPPLNRFTIDSYVLNYEKLINFSPSGSSQVLGTLTNLSSSVLKIIGSIGGFSSGDSYRFTLNAMAGTAVVTSAVRDLLSIASIAQTLGTTRGSRIFPATICLGNVSLVQNDRARVCIPPGALERSTLLSLGYTDDSDLKSRKGGGRRFSDVIHFTAEGIEFLKPAEISIRYEEPLGLSTLTPQCAILDSSCESELFRILTPLVYNSSDDAWDGSAAIKSRVRILDSNTAVFDARAFHFSSYLIAQALTILSPSNGSSLASATIGQPSYLDFVQLTGDPTSETVVVIFDPPSYGFKVTFNDAEDSVEISNNSAILRPPGDMSTSVNVTVRVTDFSSAITETRLYTIPIVDVGGEPTFSGTPLGVDSFPVFLISSNTADLSWSLASDTNRTIHSIVLEGKNLNTGGFLRLSIPRGVNTTQVPVTPGHKIYWKISTESFQGIRSDESTDFERVTFGSSQSEFSGSSTSSINSVTYSYSIPVGTAYINPMDQGVLQVLSLQGTLVSSSILDPPDGLPIDFFLESGIDINFSGVTDPNSIGSFSYTLQRTGPMRVYHYVQTKDSGAWEVLPGSTIGGHRLWAEVQDLSASTRISIFSKGGAGSPFAVGPIPLPDVIKAGGGGGCSISKEENPSGALNFFLLLISLFIPLTLLYRDKR